MIEPFRQLLPRPTPLSTPTRPHLSFSASDSKHIRSRVIFPKASHPTAGAPSAFHPRLGGMSRPDIVQWQDRGPIAAAGAAFPETSSSENRCPLAMPTNNLRPSDSLLGIPLVHIQSTGCIYMDYNGTSPVFPEVADAMRPFLEQHGNPSSGHVYGRVCKEAVQTARQHVSALINCAPDELYFTSCGTESDNWAIVGTVMAARQRSPPGSTDLPHVVTCSIEHPAVLACLNQLQEQRLATFSAVPVDSAGRVDPGAVAAAITPHTALVTIMHSNNEVGTIQPIAEISAAVAAQRSRGAEHGWPSAHILMHSDAAQSLGKVTVDVQALGVDMATVVGHKFGAPKGVAALYMRRGVQICNLFLGGGQEAGRRAGTESVLLVAGMGRAAELALLERDALAEHMSALRDNMQQQLLAALPEALVRINGPALSTERLPNTLSISIKGLKSADLLLALSDRLAASAGAACHTQDCDGPPLVSSVLTAMDVPAEFAVGTLRLSVGRHSTQGDVDTAVQLILGQAAVQGLPV